MKIAVLCAAFNRKAVTLRGLESLRESLDAVPVLDWRLYLLDDASPDGTGAAVRATFPDAVVLEGTGQLYWNQGMRRAQAAARADAQAEGPWDAYLLYNDDSVLIPEAVAHLFARFRAYNAERPTTCVGHFLDPETKKLSYSGYERLSRHFPLTVRHVVPQGGDLPCDTFCGNFVLIPGAAYEAVGGLAPHYQHVYGDVDLGYALGRAGVRLIVTDPPVGYVSDNPPPDGSTLARRWKTHFGFPHGWRQHAAFYRRNTGSALWPAVAGLGLAARLKRALLG